MASRTRSSCPGTCRTTTWRGRSSSITTSMVGRATLWRRSIAKCLPVCLFLLVSVCVCLSVSVCLHLTVRLCLSLGLSVAEVPKAVASWRSHCDQHAITVKSCARAGPFTYEKQYEKHVLDNFKEFETWLVYDAAKSVVMQLQAHGTLEEFLLMIESRGEFNRIGFDNQQAIKHAHDIKLVVSKFDSTIDKDMLKFVLLEALFFTVPLSPLAMGQMGYNYPWFFNQKPPCPQIAGLEAPMGTSMVYNKKRKVVESPGKAMPKKAAKRGAACGVDSVLEKAEHEQMDSMMDDLQTDGQTTYRQETDRQTSHERQRQRERGKDRPDETGRQAVCDSQADVQTSVRMGCPSCGCMTWSSASHRQRRRSCKHSAARAHTSLQCSRVCGMPFAKH